MATVFSSSATLCSSCLCCVSQLESLPSVHISKSNLKTASTTGCHAKFKMFSMLISLSLTSSTYLLTLKVLADKILRTELSSPSGFPPTQIVTATAINSAAGIIRDYTQWITHSGCLPTPPPLSQCLSNIYKASWIGHT